jgi:hypothetical protein
MIRVSYVFRLLLPSTPLNCLRLAAVSCPHPCLRHNSSSSSSPLPWTWTEIDWEEGSTGAPTLIPWSSRHPKLGQPARPRPWSSVGPLSSSSSGEQELLAATSAHSRRRSSTATASRNQCLVVVVATPCVGRHRSNCCRASPLSHVPRWHQGRRGAGAHEEAAQWRPAPRTGRS